MYRYYSASGGDIRSLSLPVITLRYAAFLKTHKQEMRNRAALAGIKI